MKKLVVLIMVLALMAIALPVMASDVSFSGELTAGFLSDFSSSTTTAAASNAYINLAAKVDKNNTVNAELSATYPGGTGTTLNMFYLVSDLGGAFNLSGVDPVLTVGYGDPATAATLGVSGYGNEDVVASDPGANSIGTEIAVNAAIGKTANLFIAFDPTLFTTSTNTSLVVSGNGTFGPIMAAVYYGVSAGDVSKGSIGGGAKYSTTMSGIDLGVNAQAAYDLAASAIKYGGGVSAGMKMVSGAIGFDGGPSMGLTYNVSLTPSSMYGVDVAGGLDLNNTSDLTVDGSGWVAAGATKIRVGYLYEGSATPTFGNYNAPANGNGLYATFDLSF